MSVNHPARGCPEAQMVDRALRRSMLKIAAKPRLSWHRRRSARSTFFLALSRRACAAHARPFIMSDSRTAAYPPGFRPRRGLNWVLHRPALRLVLHVPVQLPVRHAGHGRGVRLQHLPDHRDAERLVDRLWHRATGERSSDRSDRRQDRDADRRRWHHRHQSHLWLRLFRRDLHHLRGDLADERLRAVVRRARHGQDECRLVPPHRARHVRRHFWFHDSVGPVRYQQSRAGHPRRLYRRHLDRGEKRLALALSYSAADRGRRRDPARHFRQGHAGGSRVSRADRDHGEQRLQLPDELSGMLHYDLQASVDLVLRDAPTPAPARCGTVRTSS